MLGAAQLLTWFRWLVLLPIRLYRLAISPWLPPACRFYPSCSAYAEEAIQRYGMIRGLAYACGRIARCHPRCAGGYDPVR